jgi:glycosyltransferase involved in cell wall biosynthesis
LKLTFLAPSTTHPIGGIAVIYEFASALANAGHEVHLAHHELWGDDALHHIDEIEWFDFTADIHHHFMGEDPSYRPAPADIFFGWSPEVDRSPHLGLPVVFVQGWKMYPRDQEIAAYTAPCPKVCVAGWLVDIGLELGVPAAELIHVPNGLHHDRHPLTVPIDTRDPGILFCYNDHPMKDAPLGLEVLTRIHELRPEIGIVAFGSREPVHEIPSWMAYHQDPERSFLVEHLYNHATIFLCSSEVEGFGLTALEAMSCGAALVTTDNGGARDYAVHEQTALVSPPKEPEPLLSNLMRFLDNDPERITIAKAGNAHARTFTWERSGEVLEEFLERYLANPGDYGRPAGRARNGAGSSR